MADAIKGMFAGKELPDEKSGYGLYEKALQFNNSIRLDETVNVNENFYIGRQWEGVEANGLPTPQFNILKRDVGFVVSTITSDNIKVTASPMAAAPWSASFVTPAQIVNNEFEAVAERNKLSAKVREYARNAAVDGDGCTYTYFDATAETGQAAKGQIVTEIIENTRIFFGNPNDRRVQSQPWIMISRREIVRDARSLAKDNGFENWADIREDSDHKYVDSAKELDDDKVTVLRLMWRNKKTGTIWFYEFTEMCGVIKPTDSQLKLYPITWLNWDYVPDCYHGQAMITGLIPNQIFINKIWALSMLSFLRTAYPKYIYDNTRIKRIDNRVGGAIGINGGDINNAIKILDPAAISPQIAQFIELAEKKTNESLGASDVALGQTRPDNAAAIISLQRAAATPTELTKQNLYSSIEDLHRIYLDIMAAKYGVRLVDVDVPEEISRAYVLNGMKAPDKIQIEFDFATLRNHPMNIKLDVGASSYYSEIASINTLDNLLREGHITIVQYLERIPDGYVQGRRSLIAEIQRAQQQQMLMPTGTEGMGGIPGIPMAPSGASVTDTGQKAPIPVGGGFSALQRQIVESGESRNFI